MEARKQETKRSTPKLDQARRIWGAAQILGGNPTPTTHTPAPHAPAIARRAA